MAFPAFTETGEKRSVLGENTGIYGSRHFTQRFNVA
jgi:hypothetical protein